MSPNILSRLDLDDKTWVEGGCPSANVSASSLSTHHWLVIWWWVVWIWGRIYTRQQRPRSTNTTPAFMIDSSRRLGVHLHDAPEPGFIVAAQSASTSCLSLLFCCFVVCDGSLMGNKRSYSVLCCPTSSLTHIFTLPTSSHSHLHSSTHISTHTYLHSHTSSPFLPPLTHTYIPSHTSSLTHTSTHPTSSHPHFILISLATCMFIYFYLAFYSCIYLSLHPSLYRFN